MKLKNIIRFHRKKAGLSQNELAVLSGLGKTVIFDIENGKETIRLSTLKSVLKVLNIKISFTSPLMGTMEAENEKS